MVSAGNKAKSLSSVNHTTKTIYHHHHHHKTGFSINCIVCNGVSLPLFFAKPPSLKSGNCSSPLFRQSPYVLFFCDSLPLSQNWIFQETPKILKFSSLTLSHLLKFLNLNFYYLYMIRYKTFLFIIFFCS